MKWTLGLMVDRESRVSQNHGSFSDDAWIGCVGAMWGGSGVNMMVPFLGQHQYQWLYETGDPRRRENTFDRVPYGIRV